MMKFKKWMLTVMVGLGMSSSVFGLEELDLLLEQGQRTGVYKTAQSYCERKAQECSKTDEELSLRFVQLASCFPDMELLNFEGYFEAREALDAYLGQHSFKERGGACADDADLAQRLQRQLNFPAGGAASMEDEDLARALSASEGFSFEEEKRGESVFLRVKKHKDFQSIQEEIRKMFEHINSLPKGTDVHVLDKYVCQNIPKVLAFGAALELGNPDRSFREIQGDMKAYFAAYPLKMNLEGKIYPLEAFLKNIDGVFSWDPKVLTDPFRQLVSRTWTLARYIHEEGMKGTGEFDGIGLTEMANAIVENSATGGGCFEGKRNRIFGAYVRMMYHVMRKK